MATKRFSDKLESYRSLIFNSSDAQIAPLLDDIGVDNTYIEQGKTLYNETMSLVEQQKTEYQGQSLAYDKFYVEKDTAEINLKRTLKLVKALSRNDEDLQDRLKVHAAKIYAIEGWIDAAIDFYNRLNNEPEFLTRLAAFKLTSEKLEAEKTAILSLKNLRNEAVLEKGQAQEATRLRNVKLDELDNYTTELKAVAEIALETRSQLLEKLGIVVPS